MDRVASYNVARKYEKRSLLIAINAVAGLSIFFFGYDQGVMGGVNGNRNYARTMGFGDWDETKGLVNVAKPLLQGGIVCHSPTTEKRAEKVPDGLSQVAVYYLPGTLFGAFLGGWFGDRYGRIKTIALASAWAILGATLQCSAQNANWMFCGMLDPTILPS